MVRRRRGRRAAAKCGAWEGRTFTHNITGIRIPLLDGQHLTVLALFPFTALDRAVCPSQFPSPPSSSRKDFPYYLEGE